MKKLILSLSLIASTTWAGTTTIQVDEMHCAGCKGVVKETICENKDLKAQYKSCTVDWLDKAKQQGKITIVTKDAAASVDVAKVQEALKATGEPYKAKLLTEKK